MLLNGGLFKGKKIISQSSIDLMTKKHSESYATEEYADTRKLGFYYGFSLFVLENPEVDSTNSSKGIFGWSGYHNTHFWIDPQNKLYGLFMSRSREFNFGIQNGLKKAVYSKIN